MKNLLIYLLLLLLCGCNNTISKNKFNSNEVIIEKNDVEFIQTEETTETEFIQTEETTIKENELKEENRKIAEEKAHKWLADYEGEWVIDDLLSYFFAVGTIDEPDYDGTIPHDDDKYIGQTVKIDLKNNKFTIYGDDSFIIEKAYEISKKELEYTLFSPHSQGVGREYIDYIWNGDKNKNKKQPVKAILVENELDYKMVSVYLFIITTDGDLLLHVGEGVGTYTLKRK